MESRSNNVWSYGALRDGDDEKLVRAGLDLTNCPYCQEKLSLLPELDIQEHKYTEGIRWRSRHCRGDFCPVCGWWRSRESRSETYVRDCGGAAASAEIKLGAIACLKELSVNDVTIPVEEVKAYLAARYDVRFDLHPRKYEEVVAEVFRQLGYRTRITAYQNDGGIDVILDGPNSEVIGIQVKRYRGAIEVDQIRELVGALVLGGFTGGIFVTTSRFTSGAARAAGGAKLRGIPVDLLDAERFFAALQITQRSQDRDLDAMMNDIARLTLDGTRLEVRKSTSGKW